MSTSSIARPAPMSYGNHQSKVRMTIGDVVIRAVPVVLMAVVVACGFATTMV